MSGIALAGLVVSGAGAAFSFIQAGKSRGRAQDAANKAQQSLNQAKARTEMNKYDLLALNKEVYREQRDSLTAASAQVTQAAAEGDQRGVGATAGKIQAATTAAQQQVTATQSAEIQKLEMVKAQEDARLADEAMKIDIGEANQMFSTANMEREAAAGQTAQGVQGLVGVAKAGIGLAASGVGNNSMNRSMRQFGKKLGDTTSMQQAILASSTAGGKGAERFVDRGANNQGYLDFIEELKTGTPSESYMQKQIRQYYSPADIDYLKDLY